MNAAARLVHKKALSRHLALTHFFTRKQIFLLILGVGILLSSISLIYTSHLSRGFYAGYQRSLAESNQLKAEHSQLLLERSTLLMQARVQAVAEKKLKMMMPDRKATMIIHE